jgi:hypothetical protein
MPCETRRPPVSRANAVIVGVLATGLVATLAGGLWVQAAILGAGLLLTGLGVRCARRAEADTVTRVNAIEYRDARDRLIARDGFAVVGIVALALSLIAVLLTGVLLPGWVLVPAGQTLVLFSVWLLANGLAARRR